MIEVKKEAAKKPHFQVASKKRRGRAALLRKQGQSWKKTPQRKKGPEESRMFSNPHNGFEIAGA